jgi:hypothetical protein
MLLTVKRLLYKSAFQSSPPFLNIPFFVLRPFFHFSFSFYFSIRFVHMEAKSEAKPVSLVLCDAALYNCVVLVGCSCWKVWEENMLQLS